MRLRKARYGDVIYVHRFWQDVVPFDHYGIYADDGSVIHFTDWQRKEPEIIETTLADFVGESGDYSVRCFPETSAGLEALARRYDMKPGFGAWLSDIAVREYHCYTPKETVERAKGEIGHHSGEYSLLFKNCEDFAVWCKTGTLHCSQWGDFWDVFLCD